MKRTAIEKYAFTCTACGVDVKATVALELDAESAKGEGASIEIKAKVIGTEVSHNCIPQVTR